MGNASLIMLYAEDVNSGVPVILNGTSFKYKMECMTSNEPATGKWDITSNSVEGYRNPTITVTGVMSSDSIEIAATITEQLLKAFVRSKKQKYLSIKYGDTGQEQYFTNIDGSNESVFGVPYIAVSIVDIPINDRQGSMSGQVLSFSINFIEDKIL